MRTEAIDDMLMSITTPGLPPFYGNYGLWQTALVLPAMAGLRRGLSECPVYDSGHLGPEILEAGEVSVGLRADDKWPTEMQFLNCRWLEHSDADLAEAILAGLVAHIPTWREQYDCLEGPELEQLLPLDADAQHLRAHIRLLGITIHPIASGTPYLGVDFDCAWDEEHGLGLVLCGTDILEIGGGDVAASASAAQDHRDAVLASLPPSSGA